VHHRGKERPVPKQPKRTWKRKLEEGKGSHSKIIDRGNDPFSGGEKFLGVFSRTEHLEKEEKTGKRFSTVNKVGRFSRKRLTVAKRRPKIM